MTTATLPSPAASASVYQAECIRHLSVEARAAFTHFQASGDPASVDPVLLAVLADYIPRPSPRPLAELPGTTRLAEDLGFDSLALTEVVFFAEDLFAISIANDEIIQVRTLDDLSRFIRRKVAGPASA